MDESYRSLIEANKSLSTDLQRVLNNKSRVEEENHLLKQEIERIKKKQEVNVAPSSGAINGGKNHQNAA